MTSPSPKNWPPYDSRLLWLAIAAAFAVRFALLGAFPLMDPTESRYAEIARLMTALGDWITPWIAPGEPFWGKPPLSFWMTAASFEVFGVGEFAARLPHWLGAGAVAWMTWGWMASRSRREAALAVALLAGSLLFFVSAGAVMTDMALAIGLMAVMRGFWLALHGPVEHRGREQCLMFAGFAAGLLAKGPIALMAGVPIVAWAALSGQVVQAWHGIRWVAGGLAVLACVLPWFALAEAKTPGFLEYFIVGEHWQRFADSGWQGDLYGHAHAFPRGTIWAFAVVAFLPWSIVLPVIAWRRRRAPVEPDSRDPALDRYLWGWALVPCIVFTLSRNVLWTYVLPAMPALAMLAAMYLVRTPGRQPPERMVAAGVGVTTATTLAVVLAFNLGGWYDHRSLKSMVAEYRSLTRGEPLLFFRNLPYSASFYSRGAAELVPDAERLSERIADGTAFVVLRERHRGRLPDPLLDSLHRIGTIDEYGLYIGSPHPGHASRVAAKRASAASASQ